MGVLKYKRKIFLFVFLAIISVIAINLTVEVEAETESDQITINYIVDTTTTANRTTITYNESIMIENLSNEFAGWKIGETSVIISAGTEVTWEELSAYAENGKINLIATWKNESY